MGDFYRPDCPVCGGAMPVIAALGKATTLSRRSCPKCKRRFQIAITWLADRKCETQFERIPDYRKPPR